MKLPNLKMANVTNKRVLVSVDLNVTLSNGKIANDHRIRAIVPTLNYLLKQGAIIILTSHLGRPKGKVVKELSLAPVVKRLHKYLGKRINLIPDFWKKEKVRQVHRSRPGDIFLLENIRFHKGEEQNDPAFTKHLASFADVYVNDAFGMAHRAHASTVGVTAYLPAYAGILLQREVEVISKAICRPLRPLMVIIGGGKTPEKIRVTEKLLEAADTIYLGGAIANTFLAMWGISVGVSRIDHEMIEMARQVFWKATQVKSQLILPRDVIVTNGVRSTQPFVLNYDQVPATLGIFDIGPKTINEISELARKAKTIIWNGPMGMYEDKRFMKGTIATLKAVAQSQAYTIVGGGDTITTIKDKSLLTQIDHISTGGGSMLEFIEKGTLPVIEALRRKFRQTS